MQADPFTGKVAAPSTTKQYDAYGNEITQAANNLDNVAGMADQGSNVSGAGWDAANGALSGLGSFTGGDRVGGNISAAQRYASGFDVPGQVQAAMREANTNAAENDLPNLYRGAASGGNINSDRTALAQGVVERGLANKSADLTAQLNNTNYQTGLQNAQTDNANKLQALGLEGSQGQTLGNAGVQKILAALQGQGLLNEQSTAGANGSQGLDQSNLTADLQNYLSKYQLNSQALQSLMQIIGTQSWGGTQNSTTVGSGQTTTGTTTPSVSSVIAGGLGTVGSLIKK
jgi:hypothetical protein